MNRLMAMTMTVLLAGTASTSVLARDSARGELERLSRAENAGQERGQSDSGRERGDGGRGGYQGGERGAQPPVTQTGRDFDQNARGGDGGGRGQSDRGGGGRGNGGYNGGFSGGVAGVPQSAQSYQGQNSYNGSPRRSYDNNRDQSRGRGDYGRGYDNRNYSGNRYGGNSYGDNHRGRDRWADGRSGRNDRRWDGYRNHDWSRGPYYSGYNWGKRYRAPSYYVRPHGYYARSWRVGYYLPRSYYGPSYYVDYRPYGLAPPPYGYRWVRVDDDVVLIAVATGLIADIVSDFYYD